MKDYKMGIAPMNFGMPNVIDLYGLNRTNDLPAFLQSLISVNWIDREDIDDIDDIDEIDDIDDSDPDFPTQEVNHIQVNFTLEELVDIDSDDEFN